MATKRIVPRATGEGGIGRTDKLMGPSYFSESGLSENVREIEATLTTTSATPAVIWTSDALSTGNALHLFLIVAGSDPTGVYVGGYMRSLTVRTPSTGPAIIGTDIIGTDNEAGVTTTNVTASISGTTLQISVTGRAATTINWRCSIKAVYVR